MLWFFADQLLSPSDTLFGLLAGILGGAVAGDFNEGGGNDGAGDNGGLLLTFSGLAKPDRLLLIFLAGTGGRLGEG